jgi:hypothetical protein
LFEQRKKDEESDAEDKNTTSMTGEIIDGRFFSFTLEPMKTNFEQQLRKKAI